MTGNTDERDMSTVIRIDGALLLPTDQTPASIFANYDSDERSDDYSKADDMENDDDDDDESEVFVEHSSIGTGRKRRSASPEIGYEPSGIAIRQRTTEIEKLAKRRRTKGFQREDGEPELYGKQGSDERYGSEWQDEHALRMQLLEADPNYEFATLVQGNLNPSQSTLEDLVDTSGVDLAVRAQIRRAKESAREARQRVGTVETLRRNLAQRKEALQEERAEADKASDKLKEWTRSLSELATNKPEAAKQLQLAAKDSFASAGTFLVSRDTSDASLVGAALFDLMTRTAVMRFGDRGILNAGFARDLLAWFRAHFMQRLDEFQQAAVAEPAKERAKFIADNLGPQASTLALYLAMLRSVTRPPGLLQRIVKQINFRDGSAYAKQPELYIGELIALAALLMPDSGETQSAASDLLMFESVSLVLVAHINRMLRNSLYDGAQVTQPKTLAPSADKKTPRKTRRGAARGEGAVGAGEVRIDIADIVLEQMARGEAGTFTEEELAAERQKLFVNVDRDNTRMALIHLLAPLFSLGIGRSFYVLSDPLTEENRVLLAEGGLPDAGRFGGVYPTFDAALSAKNTLGYQGTPSLFLFAIKLLAMSIGDAAGAQRYAQLKQMPAYEAGDYEKMLRSFYENTQRGLTEWSAYEAYMRKRIIKRLLLKPMAAIAVLAGENTNGGAGDDALSERDAEKLRRYALAGKVLGANEADTMLLEDEVFDILENRVTGEGASRATAESALVKTRSNEAIFGYVNDASVTKHLRAEADKAKKQKAAQKKVIAELEAKLSALLLQTPEQEERQIEKNFDAEYSASRSWAQRPENSGLIRFNARFNSALANAHLKVRQYAKNLHRVPQETLQRHAATRASYARLVALEILLTEINNPTAYKRDKAFDELRQQMVSVINELKNAVVNDMTSAGDTNLRFVRTDLTGFNYFM